MMKYTGDGKQFAPGLPMRDLTDDEVKQHGKETIVSTGLYKEIKKTAEKTVKRTVNNG